MKRTRITAILSGTASVLAAAALLAGCSAGSSAQPPATTAVNFEHIHELVADPSGGGLLVGTHVGLYRLVIGAAGSTTAVGPIGGLDFDPMGFTVADGVAYASGHPGPTTPRTFGSPNLGLISSMDLGKSWRNVSLTGATDFHGLTVMTAGGGLPRVFGYDPGSQRIMRSLDGGMSWEDGPSLVARDILAVGGLLYATTPDGVAISRDEGASFTIDSRAPRLYLIAADDREALAGVDVNGSIWSQAAGKSWVRGQHVTGTAQTLAVAAGRIYVADDRGIALTDDAGQSWTVLKVNK